MSDAADVKSDSRDRDSAPAHFLSGISLGVPSPRGGAQLPFPVSAPLYTESRPR